MKRYSYWQHLLRYALKLVGLSFVAAGIFVLAVKPAIDIYVFIGLIGVASFVVGIILVGLRR